MPKKTVKEFKEIFSPIKKPRLPKGISAKDKDALEADVDSKSLDSFMAKLKAMAGNKDDVVFDPAKREYATNLIAYKMAKHIDDPKFQTWSKSIPDYLKDAAVKKIIPDDLSDPATEKLYKKALAQKNNSLVDLFQQRDGNGIRRIELAQLEESNRSTSKIVSDDLARLYESGGSDALKKAGQNLGIVMQYGDPVALAAKNPDKFFDDALEGFRQRSGDFVNAFKNPKLRKDLKKKFPEKWKDFAAKVPMLSVLEKVDADMAASDDKSDTAKIGKLFDAILDPAVLPLTYVASSAGYQVSDCLGGPTEANKGQLQNLKDVTGSPGPATDCHNLTMLTKELVTAAFGEDNTTLEFSSEGKTKGLVLTKPVSKIGGKGLIGNFKGNVVDEKGKPTGQVFYTGDGEGSAHSWVVYKVLKDGKKVGELSFDPVFGTKDDEIPASIDEQEIKWIEPGKVAETPKKKYLSKVEDYTELPDEIFDADLLKAIEADAASGKKTEGRPRNKIGITKYWTISDKMPKGVAS